MPYYKEFVECKEPYHRKPLPNYEVVPLKYDNIDVAAIQMNYKVVNPKNAKKEIRENLNHLCDLVDLAMMWPPGLKQLVVFPEFCLAGYSIYWTREDYLRIAIELPGEETEILGKKAKELHCYIVVSCHTKEKDWPNHYFNTSFIVGPEGNVIHKHWKANRDPGLYEYPTTIHDVLDEFVERYGWDAVWPVARTEIGNIATFVCNEGFQPETARAFAFKGAEILARSIGGGAYVTTEQTGIGDRRITMRSYCIENHVYGIYANRGRFVRGMDENMVADPYGRGENVGGGSSMIIDPYGRILKQVESTSETIIGDTIPIASFRKNHSIPNIRKELYAPVYAQYEGKYPPNMYSEYLPKDSVDAIIHARRKARW